MKFLEVRKRLFAASLATLVAVTTMYGNVATVLAAPSDISQTSGEYSNATAVDNVQVAQEALQTYQAALENNSQADIQAALEKIAYLTPTQRIHLFLLIYKGYYNQAFLNADFPYFNVNEYMVRYPEVAQKYAELSGEELYTAVLNDYIETGIFEGKSSCTDFDPIIALLAYPDETYQEIVAGMDAPWEGLSAIFDSYVEAEGSTTTSQYQLASDLLGDRLLEVVDDEESNYHNIFLVKDQASQKVDILPYHADQLVNVDHSDSDDYAYDDNDSQINNEVITPGRDDEPDIPEQPEDTPSQPSGDHEEEPNNPDIDPDEDQKGEGEVEYNPVNSMASRNKVGVYDLYSLDSKILTGDKSIYYVDSTVKGSVHEDGSAKYNIEKRLTSGQFNVDAYKKIAGANESGKKAPAKTTVLLYMYGTDLEEKSGDVTQSIGELLKAGYDINDLNIVIATGATKNYTATAINEKSGEYKCCYYYLDPTSLKDIAEDKKTSLNNAKTGADYEATGVINSETLVLLGQYGIDSSKADFGDSSLLAGLVDMTYDLFEADNYVLVFNDHGGGINCGIGSVSEAAKENNQSNLKMAEMEEALGSSKFYEDGNKFALIGYDACLMGGIEVAYNMSQYGDYMLGCSEEENSSWDYGDLVKAFTDSKYLTAFSSTDQSEKDVAVRNAIVQLAKDSYEKHQSRSLGNMAQSYSVINLNEIAGTVDALNKVGSAFNAILNDDSEANKELSMDVYHAMRSARARTYSNGAYDKNNLFEYVDIYDYMSQLSAAIENVKDKWAKKNGGEAAVEVTSLNDCINSISKLLSCDAIEYEGVGFSNESVYDVDSTANSSIEGQKLSFEEIAKLMSTSSAGNETTWNKLKGNLLCGTTIYMPYFSAEPDLDDKTKISSDTRYIEYEVQNLIKDYTDLVKNYVIQKNGDAESDRLNRLKDFLISDYEYTAGEGENTPSFKRRNYEDLFGKETTSFFEVAGGEPDSVYKYQYVNIPINPSYAEAKAEEIEENRAASIDTYTDFKDVLKEIKIYMIQSKDITNEDGESEKVDVVIGQAVVSDDAINGATEAINIVLERHKAYKVTGQREEAVDEEADSEEYVLASKVDVDEQILKNTFGEDAKFVLFSGNAKVSSANSESVESESILNVYNVYSVDGEKCTLKGVLKKELNLNTVENEDGTEIITYERVDTNEIMSMQYDQYVVNEYGLYDYSKEATDSSTRFIFDGTDKPEVVYSSGGLSVSDYDKANIEIIFDIQDKENGFFYSHVISDINTDKTLNNLGSSDIDPEETKSQMSVNEQAVDTVDSEQTLTEDLSLDNQSKQTEILEESNSSEDSSTDKHDDTPETNETDNQPVSPVDAAPVEPAIPSETTSPITTGEGYSASNGENGEGDSSSNGESGEGDSSDSGESGNDDSSDSAESEEGDSSDGSGSGEEDNASDSATDSEGGDDESTSDQSSDGTSGTDESSEDSSGSSSDSSDSSSSSSDSSDSSSSSSDSGDSSSSSSSSSDSSSSSSSSSDSSSSSSSDDGGSSGDSED